jgi:hypothetical protein
MSEWQIASMLQALHNIANALGAIAGLIVLLFVGKVCAFFLGLAR